MYLHIWKGFSGNLRPEVSRAELVLAGLGMKSHPVEAAELPELGLVAGAPYFFYENGLPFTQGNDWLRHIMSPKSTCSNTWRAYAYDVRQYLDYCEAAGREWSDSDQAFLQSYWRSRRLVPDVGERLTSQSWNRHAAAICSFYRYALLMGWVGELPFDAETISTRFLEAQLSSYETNSLKEAAPNSIPKWITVEQYRNKIRPAALATRQAHRNRSFLDLLVTTGWRLNEGCSQLADEWPHPDCKEFRERKAIPFLLTRGCKGGRPREVKIPLVKSVVRNVHHYIIGDREEALHYGISRAKIERGSPNLWLTEGGAPLTSGAMGRVITEIFKSAQVDGSAHTLRHTFAVHQLQASARRYIQQAVGHRDAEQFRMAMHDPLRRLQKQLGHRWLHTTMIYLDMLPDIDTLAETSLEDWTAVLLST